MDDFIPGWCFGQTVFGSPGLALVEARWVGDGAAAAEKGADDTIWLAWIPTTRTLVDQERTAAFITSHKLVQDLSHPALARVAEVGLVDGQPYAIVERLPGRSLQEFIAAGPVEPELTLEIAASLAGGLQCCHAKSLLLQGLSPASIFSDDAGHARISGFRFGRAPGFEARAGHGFFWGRIEQTAPEQIAYYAREGDRRAADPRLAKQNQPPDERADIYAWGMLVASLLTGRYPPVDRGRREDGILHLPKEPLRLPGPMGPIIERATAYLPEGRWQSARELCEALSRLRG
jgi:serine/threonine protein kinase